MQTQAGRRDADDFFFHGRRRCRRSSVRRKPVRIRLQLATKRIAVSQRSSTAAAVLPKNSVSPGPPGDADHDQIVAAAVGLLEDRIFGRDIDAERGAQTRVVAIGELGDVFEHRFLIAPHRRAAADTAAPFAVGAAARHIERAHPRAAGPRQRKAGLGGAARHIRAVDGDQNSTDRLVAVCQSAAGDGDGERPVEAVGDARDLRAESAARAAGLFNADDQEVVALLRLVGDGLGVGRLARARQSPRPCRAFLVAARRQRHRAFRRGPHLVLRFLALAAQRPDAATCPVQAR